MALKTILSLSGNPIFGKIVFILKQTGKSVTVTLVIVCGDGGHLWFRYWLVTWISSNPSPEPVMTYFEENPEEHLSEWVYLEIQLKNLVLKCHTFCSSLSEVIHWGLVKYLYASIETVIIGSGNGAFSVPRRHLNQCWLISEIEIKISVGEKLSWFIRHLSDGLCIFHTNLWNLPSDIWALPSEMSEVSDVLRLHYKIQKFSSIKTGPFLLRPQYAKTYRQISNIRCTKSNNLNISHLVLHLFLLNPWKRGV